MHCPHFFSLSATSEITELASCALSHYFQDLYSSLSSSVIYTTSISEFDANSSKKSQTVTISHTSNLLDIPQLML